MAHLFFKQEKKKRLNYYSSQNCEKLRNKTNHAVQRRLENARIIKNPM